MISILMPAYIDTFQKLKWLEQAVNSVMVQENIDWELIIVNDDSPYFFRFEDSRIKVIHKSKRLGPALCRNHAASLAKFDCLLPLDADDMLFDFDTLASMYKVWQLNQDKIIYGDLVTDDKVFKLPSYSLERLMMLDGIIPVTGMHSKRCHERIGGWKDLAGLEDTEYWLAAAELKYYGLRVNEVTLVYRKHETSRSYFIKEKRIELRNQIRTIHETLYKSRIQHKVLIEYLGKGKQEVIGKGSKVVYSFDGPPHRVEVFREDLESFQSEFFQI